MALPYSGSNLFDDVPPEDYSRISFSSGFRGESAPSQNYMLDQLRKQGFSNEYLLGALGNQFGQEGTDYFKSLIYPQAPAASAGDVATAAPTAGGALGLVNQAQQNQAALPAAQDQVALTSQQDQAALPGQGAMQGALQVATSTPATGSPEWFKNYIYQGGADDATATQRGLDYVLQQGMRPQEAVNLWNQSLGTNFSVSDFFRETGSEPLFSNFGDADSWATGSGAVNDPTTGMIKSSGAYFQRGNEAVVSDELFWNPNSPTGQALQQKVTDARAQGQRPGVVITPYAVFQGKATNEQLLEEIRNSGADFVALDPYLGWGVPADQLYEWTKNFIPQVNALGKEVKLVTQGFARKGEEDAARAYNSQLLALPGVSEFVNFGLEDWFPEGSDDAKKLFSADSEWTTLGNDYGQQQKKTIGTITGPDSRAGETGPAPAPGALTVAAGAPATAPAASAAGKPQIDTSNPASLITNILSADPNAAQRLISSRTQAFDLGESSSFYDPGETFGGFTVRAASTGYDFEGNPIGGGYTASKTESAPDTEDLRKVGLAGRPVETTLTYDASGNLTGSEKRFFKGSDSGIVYQIDPQGNVIGASEFDYSESWKGAITPLVQMATMALAPYLGTIGGALSGGALSGAAASGLGGAVVGGAGAALTGQDILKGAALGGLGAAGGQLAQNLGQAASTALGGGVLGDIAAGAIRGAAGALPAAIASEDINKLVTGALSGGVGAGTQIALSELGIPLSGAQIAQGMNFLKALQNDDVTGAVNAALLLEGSQNSKVAAAALGVANAMRTGSPQAIVAAMSGLSNALQKPVDPGEAAFLKAKQAGASDAEAAAAARAVTGGDAIDQATARATGLPIVQMAIPDIEIIDEEWGNLTQAQKDAANRLTLKVGASEANTPEEAAALARSKGYGIFNFGGNTYTLGASVQDVLSAAGISPPVDPAAAEAAKQGFNKSLAIGTNFGIQAAQILKEKFGDDLSWIDQGDLNAAASFVLAGKEDVLRSLIDSGRFGKSGQNLGAGEYGFFSPRDITNVDRDYMPPEGFRIAGPAERDTAQIAYDANGIPIYITASSGATGKRLTAAEQLALEVQENREIAGSQIDPFTGQATEYNVDENSPSLTLARGIVATAKKGFGEQIGYVGDIINSDRLREIGADMNLSGQRMTADITRQGQTMVGETLQNNEGVNKLLGLWELSKTNPGAIAAAFGDWIGTEGWQELLPVGGSVAAGKALNNASKLAFSEKLAEKIGIAGAVTVNAGIDGAEAYQATYNDVKEKLLGMGFSVEQAETNARLAGIGSAIAEFGSSAIGEGPIVAAATKGIPSRFLRSAAAEAPSEAIASGAQEALTQLATQRAGTALDLGAIQNQAILGGIIGAGTTGAVDVAANLGSQITGGSSSNGSTTSTSGNSVNTTNSSGQTTNISVTNNDLNTGNLTNNVTAAVGGGSDAASIVSNVSNAAANSGVDVNAATNAAVDAANAAGAQVTVTGNNVNSTQTNNNVTTNSTVNNATGDSTSTSVNNTTGDTTQSTTSGSQTTQVSTNAATGATTEVKTDAKTGTATETKTDGNVTSQVTTDAKTGNSTNVTTNAGTNVTTSVTNDANTNTSTTTNTDANTNVTSQVTTNTNNNTTSQVTTDANTNVTTQVTADANTGTNTETTTNSNTGVTSQVTTDSNTNTSTQVTTDSNTNVTTQVVTNSNTGVNTETSTDANTNVTTQVVTDTNNNTTTQTTTDNNTNITTQVTTDSNTTTETKTNNNTNVTTQVTTDTNTGTTTQITSNPNTNVTTVTTTNSNVETTTTINTNTNTQTTVVVDVNTGDIIDLQEGEVTLNVKLDPVKPLDPIKPLDPVGPISPVSPVNPPKGPTTPKIPQDASGAMFLPAVGGMMPRESIGPQFLKSFETQGYIDPLAALKAADTQPQGQDLMQQVDPRLAAILQQRMGQPQGEDPIGALARMLSGEPEAVNNPYYSYGQEDSIDDILGGKAAGFAKGGYVAPLQMADGGMALPLLAKAGGHAREDFRDGKHVAGDGDGQSDDIPAWLADGEFVFPADVVSALGNGSTKAGTDKLYEMMHNIRERARSKGPKDLPPPALKSPLDYLKSKK